MKTVKEVTLQAFVQTLWLTPAHRATLSVVLERITRRVAPPTDSVGHFDARGDRSVRPRPREASIGAALAAVVLLTACAQQTTVTTPGAASSTAGPRATVATAPTSAPSVASTAPLAPRVPSPSPIAPRTGATSTATAVPAATPIAEVGAAGVPAFSHIFLIVLENAAYGDVYHAPAMPYLNSLGDQYTVATASYAVAHPSLPNYLALLGGSTFGVTSDCVTCTVNAPNLTDQLDEAGKSWSAYNEGMPSVCSSLPDWPPGRYAKKHNPFLYFDDIRGNSARCAHDVPYSNLASDLAGGKLANFVWITPDLCHDAHDCPLSQADAWLASALPPILNSAAFQQGGALFITFDEGSDTAAAGPIAAAAGGQVFTLVASPLAKRGAQVSVPYDHYSLLRTIEDAWRLPHLAHAADPATSNMAACFSS